VRKDGSEALAGERPAEDGKGTVRLRREPPVFAVPRLFVERTVRLRKEFHDPPALRSLFVPVVKETSHDFAKVESRVRLSAGTLCPNSFQSS